MPVLAHSVAEPGGVPHLPVGRGDSATDCSATTCSAFHIQYHCNNFLETVDRALESRVDYEHFAVWRGGRPTFVSPSRSASIRRCGSDRDGRRPRRRGARRRGIARPARRAADLRRRSSRLHEGHPGSLAAFERLLERRPPGASVSWCRSARRVAIISSRINRLSHEVDAIVAVDQRALRRRIAGRPIVYRNVHHGPAEIATLYRACDVCVVSSLHDGMNLVAKEFVAARTDSRACCCCRVSRARRGTSKKRCR